MTSRPKGLSESGRSFPFVLGGGNPIVLISIRELKGFHLRCGSEGGSFSKADNGFSLAFDGPRTGCLFEGYSWQKNETNPLLGPSGIMER